MKLWEEKKLVVFEATNDEIRTIEEIDFAIVGDNGNVFVDLETYAEYVEKEHPIIEEALTELKWLGIEADVIHFKTI